MCLSLRVAAYGLTMEIVHQTTCMPSRTGTPKLNSLAGRGLAKYLSASGQAHSFDPMGAGPPSLLSPVAGRSG